MNRRPSQNAPAPTLRARIGVTLLILIGLLAIGSIIALMFGAGDEDFGANTAIIPVTGLITTAPSDGLFSEPVASSGEIVEQIERAREEGMLAIILEIDTPGGSAVASDEIAQAVKAAREDGVVTVAWIREMGASGGYWVASSSEHIVANRMSVTGSIGVFGSYLEFSEFIDDWNVTYRRLVAGERKDVGDPFTELTPSQRAFLQGKLDAIHRFFIEEIAGNRNMTYDDVAALADGRFFLGVEAKEAGLIDELGGKEEAIAYIENATGIAVVTTEYEEDESLLDILAGIASPARAPSVEDLARGRTATREFAPQLR